MASGFRPDPARPAEDDAYLDRLDAMPPGFTFVIGPHRSGTTFLHHLLAQSGSFNYVSAYDVIAFDQLLAHRVLGREEAVRADLAAQLSRYEDRGLDGIPVGIDYAEEYGFLLNLQVYEPRLTPATLDRFRLLCAKRHFLSSRGLPLLLKEPSEFYGNFGFIHGEFPSANLLFVHRHPLAVIDSQVRSWKKAVESQSHYGSLLSKDYARIAGDPAQRARYRIAYDSVQGAEWVLDYVAKGYAYYLDEIRRLPRDRVLVDTYESICTAPRRYFARAAKFLGVALPEPEAAAIAPRQMKISPLVLTAYERNLGRFREYLDHFEYPDLPEE